MNESLTTLALPSSETQPLPTRSQIQIAEEITRAACHEEGILLVHGVRGSGKSWLFDRLDQFVGSPGTVLIHRPRDGSLLQQLQKHFNLRPQSSNRANKQRSRLIRAAQGRQPGSQPWILAMDDADALSSENLELFLELCAHRSQGPTGLFKGVAAFDVERSSRRSEAGGGMDNQSGRAVPGVSGAPGGNEVWRAMEAAGLPDSLRDAASRMIELGGAERDEVDRFLVEAAFRFAPGRDISFSPQVVARIHRESRGLPGLILNRASLCLKLAIAQGLNIVDEACADRIGLDLSESAMSDEKSTRLQAHVAGPALPRVESAKSAQRREVEPTFAVSVGRPASASAAEADPAPASGEESHHPSPTDAALGQATGQQRGEGRPSRADAGPVPSSRNAGFETAECESHALAPEVDPEATNWASSSEEMESDLTRSFSRLIDGGEALLARIEHAIAEPSPESGSEGVVLLSALETRIDRKLRYLVEMERRLSRAERIAANLKSITDAAEEREYKLRREGDSLAERLESAKRAAHQLEMECGQAGRAVRAQSEHVDEARGVLREVERATSHLKARAIGLDEARGALNALEAKSVEAFRLSREMDERLKDGLAMQSALAEKIGAGRRDFEMRQAAFEQRAAEIERKAAAAIDGAEEWPQRIAGLMQDAHQQYQQLAADVTGQLKDVQKGRTEIGQCLGHARGVLAQFEAGVDAAQRADEALQTAAAERASIVVRLEERVKEVSAQVAAESTRVDEVRKEFASDVDRLRAEFAQQFRAAEDRAIQIQGTFQRFEENIGRFEEDAGRIEMRIKSAKTEAATLNDALAAQSAATEARTDKLAELIVRGERMAEEARVGLARIEQLHESIRDLEARLEPRAARIAAVSERVEEAEARSQVLVATLNELNQARAAAGAVTEELVAVLEKGQALRELFVARGDGASFDERFDGLVRKLRLTRDAALNAQEELEFRVRERESRSRELLESLETGIGRAAEILERTSALDAALSSARQIQDILGVESGQAAQKIDELGSHTAAAAGVLRQLSDGVRETHQLLFGLGREMKEATALAARQGETSDRAQELISRAENQERTLQKVVQTADPLLARFESAVRQAGSHAGELRALENSTQMRADELNAAKMRTVETVKKLEQLIATLQVSEKVHAALEATIEKGRDTSHRIEESAAVARGALDALAEERDQINGCIAEGDRALENNRVWVEKLREAGEAGEMLYARSTAVHEECRAAFERLHAESRDVDALLGRCDNVLATVTSHEETLETSERMIREFAKQANGLAEQLKALHAESTSLRETIAGLTAAPEEVTRKAQEQAAQLEQVCQTVRKIFAGLSKAGLEANEKINQLRELSSGTDERLAFLTEQTQAASRMLRDSVEDAIRAQGRLAATLEKAPALSASHTRKSLSTLAEGLQAPLGPSAKRNDRLGGKRLAGEPPLKAASDTSPPAAPTKRDAETIKNARTRSEEIAAMIREAQRAERTAAQTPS